MGGLGRKFLHKLPDLEILRNLEAPFILWIHIDIYFLASTNYTFCRIAIYKRIQEHCLTTPWLPAGLPPRRSRAMHTPPGRLDRSREAIGAGRGREERPYRGPPLGLRPPEAERPVVGKLRHETDRSIGW